MKILHISTRLIVGGSQENTILSCRGQIEKGHDVHLAFGPIFGPEGSMLDDAKSGGKIRTHEVPDLVREIAPLRDWRAYRQLRKLIREIDPDVVNTHSSKAGILGRAAGWAEGGKAGKRTIVHTIHGPPFHKYEKPWRNRLYIASERFAAKRCHAITSVANAMTNQYLAEHIGKSEQYTTVYSGMDTEPYLNPPATGPDSRASVRTELGLADSDIVIGTVSRLAELKGHDDIITALADDLQKRSNWKLLWIGDGWKRQELEQRLDELGLRQHVVMTGLVPPDQVPRFVRAMDLLVHPSYREGLPRTVPQALLSAVPVVANDVDGTSEACIEMQTGRLVAPGDLAGLREAIQWTIEHLDHEAKTLALAGRELCRERFDWRTMVDDLEKVYEGSKGATGRLDEQTRAN